MVLIIFRLSINNQFQKITISLYNLCVVQIVKNYIYNNNSTKFKKNYAHLNSMSGE